MKLYPGAVRSILRSHLRGTKIVRNRLIKSAPKCNEINKSLDLNVNEPAIIKRVPSSHANNSGFECIRKKCGHFKIALWRKMEIISKQQGLDKLQNLHRRDGDYNTIYFNSIGDIVRDNF